MKIHGMISRAVWRPSAWANAMILAGRERSGVACIALLLLCGISPASAFTQDFAAPGAGWELGASLGTFNDEGEFGPGNRAVQLERGSRLGVHAGRIFESGFFLQADVAYAPDLRWVGEDFFIRGDAGAMRDLRALTAGLSAGYGVRPLERVEVYGSVGGGLVRWDVEGMGSQVQPSMTLGAGTRVFMTSSLAFRADARWRHTSDAMGGIREEGGFPTDPDGLWVVEATAGLAVYLTAPERDTDGDGVGDRTDLCPDTPAYARVDAAGCPYDRDGDGVLAGLDQCPRTAPGVRVDGDGCALDTDGDGVPDGLDRCPDSAGSARVDASGCVPDTDGDRVADADDQCPNTARETPVDADGCPLNLMQRALEETGRVVLHGVYFDFNRATLRPESRISLDQAGEALVRNPSLRVEIQGHTDAIGSDAYNFELSERRAQAVYDYLGTRFADLDAGRLSVRGYGETSPVATNESAEGRQENRRVEFVVVRR